MEGRLSIPGRCGPARGLAGCDAALLGRRCASRTAGPGARPDRPGTDIRPCMNCFGARA